jgi:hypothetical protein
VSVLIRIPPGVKVLRLKRLGSGSVMAAFIPAGKLT